MTSVEGESTDKLLDIRLFGVIDVRVSGDALPPLHSRRGLWLLAILALKAPTTLDRLQLAGLLWPDSPDSTALHNLRQTLADLRRALGPAACCLRSESRSRLCLDVTHVDVDVADFDAALREGSEASLERAVTLYRGGLLEGCDEPWAAEERNARERAYLEALDKLAAFSRSRRDLANAARWLRMSIDADPFRESAYRDLMNSLSDGGQLAAATEVYRNLRRLLHHELNAEPDPATSEVYRKIRDGSPERGSRPARKRTPVTTATLSCAVRPLPVPLTGLIGREEAVREVASLVAHSRLVTLTGTGGIGKTRLSIEVARAVEDEFADGVCFVSLSGLSDSSLVPDAVREALGIIESDAQQAAEETLTQRLVGRSLLVILDNCEHLLPGCAGLAHMLLGSCPDLRILATSRQALGFAAESLWRVPPLAMPAVLSTGFTPERMDIAEPSAALELFVERARSGDPTFRMTFDNSSSIVEICRRLDGIPLAIELAAAQARFMPVDEICSRLRQGFKLLAGKRPDVAPRHRTLESAIDWSWDLLNEEERDLLNRLSVFAGGWSLGAAGSVGEEERIGGSEVLEVLSSLVDKSLVLYIPPVHAEASCGEPPATSRYFLLDTIREYAVVKLRATDDYDAANGRHRDFFLDWAEKVGPKLMGADQARWFRSLEVERDNLRAALNWCRSQGDLEEEYRLVIVLTRFWNARGYVSEGRAHIDAAVARMTPQLPHVLRTGALICAGWLAYVQGDNRAARESYERALTILRELDVEDQAIRRFDWDPGSQVTTARVLGLLGGNYLEENDYVTARALIEESLAIHRRLGKVSATQLSNLGCVLMKMGDMNAARAYLEESAALCESSQTDPQQHGVTLSNLAMVAYKQGCLEQSLLHCAAALRRLRDCGLLIEFATPLHQMALIAVGMSRWEDAARLLGAATAVSQKAQFRFSPDDATERAKAELAIERSLGRDALVAAVAAGEQMTLSEATRYALEFASSPD